MFGIPEGTVDGACLETLALDALTLELTGAADGFGLFARTAFGRLFVRTAQFHFTEDALALHFLFERLKSLIDVVITNGDLHGCLSLSNYLQIGHNGHVRRAIPASDGPYIKA